MLAVNNMRKKSLSTAPCLSRQRGRFSRIVSASSKNNIYFLIQIVDGSLSVPDVTGENGNNNVLR